MLLLPGLCFTPMKTEFSGEELANRGVRSRLVIQMGSQDWEPLDWGVGQEGGTPILLHQNI